jgi:hypothetical protein
MDPAALIPSPGTLQVSWMWYELFLVLTFTAHILVMNLMLGWAVIGLTEHVRHRGGTSPVAREVSAKLPFAVAFTINLGVAPYLFSQVLYGQFLYTSSVLMAVAWLSVVGLVLAGYGAAYWYDFRFANLAGKGWLVLGVTVACLVTTSFFFSNNMTLMLEPEHWPAYFENPDGTMLNLGDPTLIPRWLHFVVAAMAVGGLGLAVLGSRRSGEEAEAQVKLGMRWFFNATLIQFGVGIWFLISLPRNVLLQFMGGSLPGPVFFIFGLSGAILCLHQACRGTVRGTMHSLLATVVAMVLMRETVRFGYLAPNFSPADLEVVPQFSPLVVFLIALGLGGLGVWYMFKLAFRAK